MATLDAATVIDDPAGVHAPGDITVWRNGASVTLTPQEVKRLYEMALNTRESAERLREAATDEVD